MTNHHMHLGDCLEILPTLPDNSVDLILTDPPYFKVKGDAWDNQWDKPDQFLGWMDAVVEQLARVLKPNGSLYLFASPQMAARVECKVADRLNVLNNITWYKSYSHYGAGGNHTPARCSPPALRSFYDQSERIIFAEHYGADNIAKGEAGYAAKCDDLRGFVFEPLRAYIAGEFDRAGMLNPAGKIAANVACGFSASAGGMASRHYFGTSQWQLPTEKHYMAMRDLLNREGGQFLRREYEDLRREYEDLRRPFTVSPSVPYTDVWDFPTVKTYKGKHPCEKPQALLRHIIEASSRPGAVVLDAFAGSGATGVACKALGRSFIGIEMGVEWCEKARARIEAAPGIDENSNQDTLNP